jgi:hypothetical protein
MADLVTTLTLAATILCHGCPTVRMGDFHAWDAVNIQRQFLDPSNPAGVHFDYARTCFGLKAKLKMFDMQMCISSVVKITGDRFTRIAQWQDIEDHDGDCVLLATSKRASNPADTVEYFVCLEQTTS